MNIIGLNLKKLRESKGLTQNEVAHYLSISRSAIAQYESGGRNVPISHLLKLSDLYGIKESDLLKEDIESVPAMIFAFRTEALTPDDLSSIAKFKRIVMNYVNMSQSLNG